MEKLAKNISLFLALTLATSISLLSCGGGGGGSGGGGGQASTINGRVADVMTVMAPMGEKSSMLALIKDFFSFSKKANAQGSGVAGIEVIAEVNGEEVDDDTTDGGGNFELTVPGGSNVTLIFTTDDFTLSIEIFAPEGGVVNLVVTLNPDEDEVIVDEGEAEDAIDCETGTVEITKELGVDLVIDGEGEDCIRARGNCIVNIDPENIVLTNCERCIRAEGGAQVTLTTTDGDVICDASEDGIRAEGNATVNLGASGNIDISAGESEIRAEGTSTVNVSADGECIIFFPRIEGNATVNFDDCILVVP